jgi:hypothetical protein
VYYLYQAIQIVLSEQPSPTATTDFISEEIWRRHSYRQSKRAKNPGGMAPASQIQVRAFHKPELFLKVAPQTFKLIGPKTTDDRG